MPPAPVPASSLLLAPSGLPSPYGVGSRSSAAGSTSALNPNPPAAGRSPHLYSRAAAGHVASATHPMPPLADGGGTYLQSRVLHTTTLNAPRRCALCAFDSKEHRPRGTRTYAPSNPLRRVSGSSNAPPPEAAEADGSR